MDTLLDTLMLTDDDTVVDTLELNEVDIDVLVLALDELEMLLREENIMITASLICP